MSGGNSSQGSSQNEVISQGLQVGAYSVVMVVSLVGNLLVIVTYKKDKNELKKLVMSATICHMATADLITTVVGVPYMITLVLYNRRWLISGWFGVVVCKSHAYAIEVGFAVSALSIGVIAVERFLSVFYPLKKILTVKKAHVISAVVWATACCFYAPKLYSINVFKHANNMYCDSRFDQIRPWREIEACLYTVLFLVTLVLYIAIVLKVTRGNSIPGRVLTETSQIARSRKNRRVIRQGLGVITIHYLCWLPYLWIYVTCVVFRLKIMNVCQNTGIFHGFVIFFLGFSNAALNPILYTATNESFRKGCKAVMQNMRASCGARVTPTANFRNSRVCSSGQTRHEKPQENGAETRTENLPHLIELNLDGNGSETVELRGEEIQETGKEFPRIVIVTTS